MLYYVVLYNHESFIGIEIKFFCYLKLFHKYISCMSTLAHTQQILNIYFIFNIFIILL